MINQWMEGFFPLNFEILTIGKLAAVFGEDFLHWGDASRIEMSLDSKTWVHQKEMALPAQEGSHSETSAHLSCPETNSKDSNQTAHDVNIHGDIDTVLQHTNQLCGSPTSLDLGEHKKRCLFPYEILGFPIFVALHKSSSTQLKVRHPATMTTIMMIVHPMSLSGGSGQIFSNLTWSKVGFS